MSKNPFGMVEFSRQKFNFWWIITFLARKLNFYAGNWNLYPIFLAWKFKIKRNVQVILWTKNWVLEQCERATIYLRSKCFVAKEILKNVFSITRCLQAKAGKKSADAFMVNAISRLHISSIFSIHYGSVLGLRVLAFWWWAYFSSSHLVLI